MTESWQRELNKLDALEPPPSLPSRIGRSSFHGDPEPTSKRIGVIVVAFAVFIAAGVFAWVALRPHGVARQVSTPTTSELPDVATIVCGARGTLVPDPAAQVQADGPHFVVDNQSGMDEVLLSGTSGPARGAGGDIPLSKDSHYTFHSWPPGDLLVGCFTNDQIDGVDMSDPSLTRHMVPLSFEDPDHLFVSTTLQCGSSGENDSGPYLGESASSPEALIRSTIPGIQGSDLVEPSGYPSDAAHTLHYAVERAGRVVASVSLEPPPAPNSSPSVVHLSACRDSGIGSKDVPGQGSDVKGQIVVTGGTPARQVPALVRQIEKSLQEARQTHIPGLVRAKVQIARRVIPVLDQLCRQLRADGRDPAGCHTTFVFPKVVPNP